MIATAEEDLSMSVTEELNRRSRSAPFIGEHMATSCELMMTPSQGTPSVAVEGDSIMELNSPGMDGLKAMNKDIKHRYERQRDPNPERRMGHREKRTMKQKQKKTEG